MINPRHVICAIGNWADFEPIKNLLLAYRFGFELDRNYSSYSANPRMKRSFEVNQDRSPNTLTQDDWDAIETHRAVAYILSPPLNESNAQEISGEALRIIASLFRSGATAIQSESAGLSHGKEAWLTFAREYEAAEDNNDEFKMGSCLYKAWVQKVDEAENNLLFTLGMQLLGRRDIEFKYANEPTKTAIEWIDLLGLYILADRPTRPIKNGEGFSPRGAQRKIISHETCIRKLEDDFQFNPYGYFRLNDETRSDKLKRFFSRKRK